MIAIRPGTPAGIVDHFAIGVAPFDRAVLLKELRDRGAIPEGDTLYVRDPNGIRVQLMASVPK